MTEPILEFAGEHRFLSNFAPAEVVYAGRTYPTVEHAYVAAKTMDLELRREIQGLKWPGQAKKFGNTLALRPGWENMKVEVMRDLVWQKFQQIDMAGKLLATGRCHLEEGNGHRDRFWGVCPVGSIDGDNRLGHMLMEVRAGIRFGLKEFPKNSPAF